MTTQTLTPHESWVLAHAEYFTAYAFRGRGERVKIRCASRAEACRVAQGIATDRGSMVYAVYRNHQALTDVF